MRDSIGGIVEKEWYMFCMNIYPGQNNHNRSIRRVACQTRINLARPLKIMVAAKGQGTSFGERAVTENRYSKIKPTPDRRFL